MNIFKSIISVLAGILMIVILSIGTDKILEATGVFPPDEQIMTYNWMLALAFFYRSIYAVAGGYLTAALAPDKPIVHVLILGGIGVLASIGGVIHAIQMNMSSLWYPVALVLTTLPLCWLGGKLKTK